ncbi:12717_t:CDS:2 [Racocetra fulgida]|uniref:12717_t:CDS:1 n=1 Tax=Racocetra fulgida TaxID=60492 RepID=A0A9N8VQE0_9GLOM|nr:12717_t:CDS:2 [Racocetra fulgida]
MSESKVQELIEIVQNSLEEDPRTVRLGMRDIREIPLELINLTTSNNYKIESNSENGIERDIIARSKSLKKTTSVDTHLHPTSNFLNASTKTENGQVSSKLEKKRPNSKLSLDFPIARRERSYSNDFDSMSKNLRSTFIRTHSKSYSQDSISSHGSQNGISEEHSSDFYFHKLKTLPPVDNLPMSSLSLREASRNVLYALSQIHKAMYQFISFTGSERIFFTELNKTNASIGQLSMRLQRFDIFSQKAAPDADHCIKLLGSCQENITNFKILLDLFNKRIKTLTQSPDNLRYSRTLLLIFHGSIVDIKFAWENILPLLNNNMPFTGIPTPIRSKSISRSNSTSSLNGYSYSNGLLSNGSSHTNGINISSAGMSITNNSHTDVTFPPLIFEQMLTKVDTAIKWVENVGKHLTEHLENALGSSTDVPASPVKIKLKEMKLHMKNVLDVTRQLKKSLLAARFLQNEHLNIQLKVYSTTIVFLQATVKMSTLAKDISQEWRLNTKIMSGLGHVTKSNIELSNFLRAIEYGELPIRMPPPPPPSEAESEKSDDFMVYNENFLDQNVNSKSKTTYEESTENSNLTADGSTIHD